MEPSNTRFISRSRGEFRLERESAVAAHVIAKFFEMDFKSGTLFRRGRPALPKEKAPECDGA
jgi:hypothetical protein